ncbi:MAG TPA: hypothetical protein VLD16_00950 [Gaiellaceae bacterium]|nr:hypothetical protein [Gaiellaceae bacterium]
MALVDQWRAIADGLPGDWAAARLRLTLTERGRAERAAALLGPANPGLYASFVTFQVARGGAGTSAELARRLLARLDAERIGGTLKLIGVDEAPGAQAARRHLELAQQWELLSTELPEDWSDLYAEIELASSDYLDPGALRLAPVNPTRVPDRLAFRFRVARRFGYGASPEMTRRCLERLDAESIRGTLRILWALSDTRPVYTQGPVWYVGGRAV